MRNKAGADTCLAAYAFTDFIGFSHTGLLGPVGIRYKLPADHDKVGFTIHQHRLHIIRIIDASDNGNQGFLYDSLNFRSVFYIAAPGVEHGREHAGCGSRIMEGRRGNMNNIHLSIQQFGKFHRFFNRDASLGILLTA